ncbi:MAG: hypothetical protein ABL971_15600 [Vicinamibacterales bacterium]
MRSFTVELGLAGHSSGERLRGRVVAGFAEPDAMRLEGVAPFGAPVFVLVASAGTSTLLLPRESAVLTDEAPDVVLEALTGLSLGPADLRALLTGCVTDAPVAAGASFGDGWASLSFTDATTMFLRRGRGGWVVRGANRAGWQVEFQVWAGTFPSQIRLRSADTDLVVQVRQVEANITLDPAAFTVAVPPGTRPVTLDDIRRAGTLKETP